MNGRMRSQRRGGLQICKLGQCVACDQIFKFEQTHREQLLDVLPPTGHTPLRRNAVICDFCIDGIASLFLDDDHDQYTTEEQHEMLRSSHEAIKHRSRQVYFESWKKPGLNQFDAQVMLTPPLKKYVEVKRTDKLEFTFGDSLRQPWPPRK